MKRIFTAAVAVAAISVAGATPVRATTFPTLTQIYFASGARDNSVDSDFTGIGTIIDCTNMSGQTASVRYQFRHATGQLLAGATLLLANLATKTITSMGSASFTNDTPLPTGTFLGGSIQILSTQSAVYCSAMIIRTDGGDDPSGVALHMVRFNPHPGTVE